MNNSGYYIMRNFVIYVDLLICLRLCLGGYNEQGWRRQEIHPEFSRKMENWVVG
jgi:hypothetical protein